MPTDHVGRVDQLSRVKYATENNTAKIKTKIVMWNVEGLLQTYKLGIIEIELQRL